MAEHAELLAEMNTVGRLSATERLKHAQKRRTQQLKDWAQIEKNSTHNSAQKRDGKKRKVTFPTNITLLEAAARNDRDEVRDLLNNGVSPDLVNEDGLTALHQCCIDDFVDVARCLLDAGANVNACDSELWTPLHAAATCGHTNLVQLLLDTGAALLAVNADGNMAYDLCEDEATLELIEMVMADQGITQERIDECRGAKESEMLRDLREVLENVGDLSLTDEQGASLLHIAAANGYVSVGELLLENKVSPDDRDNDGWTPLHAAACWGQIQMVELLVANGASLNARSGLDETPLDVCGDEEVRAKIMELKQKHDAIMKGQEKHKSDLQRRVSSAGSRGKVVRRSSVNERSSLYRREHQKEAMVWQERQTDALDDDEDRQTDAELNAALVSGLHSPVISSSQAAEGQNGAQDSVLGNGSVLALSSLPGEGQSGGRRDRSASYQLTFDEDSMSRERSHQTLADLKRQRAAAKLQKHPAPPLPVSADPRGNEPVTEESPASEQLDESASDAVYFTPSSGDPPLLKLRAPEEEDTSNTKEPCCRLM
ncbi:protein phosphatase 1 regulatory subunit 16A [Triplophysa dalaica]|uniref:protein phosphatase 1 regulatory subunit 16A n=1 Tax=Triplophysa dalaica TaxID=1582913 RepID=UPI0024DFF076|nr:protein phosphatase 1 regulatory subunit 16A [Triplophysa dalaica]